MNNKIKDWFQTGRVGASSEAMALAVGGMPVKFSHPLDPSDLNRCLVFLRTVPEAKQHLDKVAALSPYWERLIARWDELEKCFNIEVGEGWAQLDKPATITYALIQEILYPKEAK